MKKIKKHELVDDKNNYAYKCLKCGGKLIQDDHGSSWDNLSLDRMELQHCPNCEITYEYYYGLDCVGYDEDGESFTMRFTNDPFNDYIGVLETGDNWNIIDAVAV